MIVLMLKHWKFNSIIKENLKLDVKQYYKHILGDEYYELVTEEEDGTFEFSDDFEEVLDSKEFKTLLNTIFELAVNMQLSNPPILLELINFEEILNANKGNKLVLFATDF